MSDRINLRVGPEQVGERVVLLAEVERRSHTVPVTPTVESMRHPSPSRASI